MKTKLLEGTSIRDSRKDLLANKISLENIKPHLVIVWVGDRDDSSAYVAQKQKFGKAIGAKVTVKNFSKEVSEKELIEAIDIYNNDKDVSGIILQLPVPDHIDQVKVINTIDPIKDVDGLTDENQNKLEQGQLGIVPATARGVFSLLDYYKIPVRDRKFVVLGRSRLVGKPISLLAKSKGAIVNVCHSKTENTKEIAKEADILVSATGVAGLVTSEFVKDGAVVIDVGINLVGGEKLEEEIPKKRFVGDVVFDEVFPKVSAITPVPGGVGPMTVVSLFENLLDAYQMQKNQKSV